LTFLLFLTSILLIDINNIGNYAEEVKMNAIQQVEARRDAVLEQMRAIRSMERGSITKQFLKVAHKGKKEPALRGPYYVITRREGNKTVGYRLSTPEEVERAQQDVEAHKQFLALCREFEQLTEHLGRLERGMSEAEEVKKGLKSRSRRTRK
jgi:hypothetical protein